MMQQDLLKTEVNAVKKKLVTVLLVIVVVLCLVVAGAIGFLWYRDNHVFVEGKPYSIHAVSLDLREEDISFGYYDTLHAQLPNCEILWNVPFQNTKYSNDTRSIRIETLTDEDIAVLLEYFPKLDSLDASACRDYAMLESFQAQKPDCEVKYQVDLGGKAYDPDTEELVLENGDYALETLMENLPHLPQVRSILLKKPDLTLEQIDQLKSAYEQIEIKCTVELLGQEFDTETTELDLSQMEAGDVEQVAQKLAMLPALAKIELVNGEGISRLDKESVKKLMAAAPEAQVHYVFDFYGQTLSTDTEEVHIKNTNIGDEGEQEVRLALDMLTNCRRFVLENCQISNEVMAKLRDDYRDRTKVVWRVSYGGGSCMTDSEVIRCTYELTNNNSKNLIYCEDIRFVDVGHNDVNYLSDFSFVAGMPKLEAIILSSAYVKDLTPFANCKELKFFEAAFCGLLEDISPLAGCEKLEMVNISFTKVKDLSPLDNLPIKTLCAKNYSNNRVSEEDQKKFAELHPDCWAMYVGEQPYGAGWRYTEDEKGYLPYYAMLRKVFRLDDSVIPNSVGWYLREGDTDLPEAEAAGTT